MLRPALEPLGLTDGQCFAGMCMHSGLIPALPLPDLPLKSLSFWFPLCDMRIKIHALQNETRLKNA